MTVVLASVAYWAPVELRLAGDDGKPEIIHFRARYKRLKKSERQALDKRVNAGRAQMEHALLGKPLPDDLAEPIKDDEMARMLVVDWDLKDKGGNLIVFTPAALDEQSEELYGLETALIKGWFDNEHRCANPEEAAKNSAPPSATS